MQLTNLLNVITVKGLIEMFTADGDLDLEDLDHLKYVILKIKIRSRS